MVPLPKRTGPNVWDTTPSRCTPSQSCIAKKYEGMRPEPQLDEMREIDATLTTRELAYLIKEAGIDFRTLPDGERDSLMGESSGAATIFGVTGGVMEAALRLLMKR